MKSIILLFSLIALSLSQDTFNLQYVPPTNPELGLGSQPEGLAETKFNFMDAPLIDLVWCGNKKEVIFFLTEKNTLYRSVDDGFSGHRLTEHLEQLGKRELAGASDVGEIARIIQSPSDKNMLIILGTAGVSWITEDCGAGFRAMDAGRPVEEFVFHPTERNWLLASAWTKCEDFPGEPCKKYKELFVSKNLGGAWDLIASYVFQFSWGRIDQTFYRVPKERVIISHEVGAAGDQKLINWSDKLEIAFSDDFFKTTSTVLPRGNKFLVTSYFFFAVQFNKEDTHTITLYVADPKAKNYTMRPIELPVKRLLEHSYTILDTAEHSVFLHINHDGDKSEYGTIYVSDSTGFRYSASLPGNIINRDGQCDFERVQGVDGIYLANIIDKEARQRFKNLDFDTFSQQGPGAKKTSESSAEASAAFSVEAAKRSLHDFKQTMISFNKGATWQKLTPPDKDSEGKKIACTDEDNCFLHLHSISNTKFGPFYTTENSLGLILGTGNVGKFLSNNADEINTYLSRDAGLTWFEIAKGSHIYEIGDHGSIIVLAPDQHATKEVYYSWNEGLTWETLVVSENPVEITNIIIEPSNTAEKFLIYGRETGETKRGVVIAADFTPIHKRECQGVNNPDTPESDYETWTPGGKISPHCLLGKQTTYTRRKRDAECFNREDHDRWRFNHRCECTEDDWECDYGFVRVGSGPCLPLDEKTTNKERTAPEECEDYYYITQGYRKVGGNQCENGIAHDPIKIPCPKTIMQKSQNIMAIAALVVVILILLWKNSKGKGAKTEKVMKVENAKPWFSGLRNLLDKLPRFRKNSGKGGNGFVRLNEEPESMKDDENVFGKIEFEEGEEADEVEEYNQDQITQRRKMTARGGIETANKRVPTLHKPGEKKGSFSLLDE